MAKREASIVRKNPGENSKNTIFYFFSNFLGKIEGEKNKWQFLIKIPHKTQIENSKSLTIMISLTL